MELTENEFLISRALSIYNEQYHRDIKVADCEITSIPHDPHSDRGYEITTPTKDQFFRIHFYVKFTNNDRSAPVRLEVTPPYVVGALGDEVFVVRSGIDEWYRSSGMYRFTPIVPMDVPPGTFITERGIPLVTEYEAFLISEAA